MKNNPIIVYPMTLFFSPLNIGKRTKKDDIDSVHLKFNFHGQISKIW